MYRLSRAEQEQSKGKYSAPTRACSQMHYLCGASASQELASFRISEHTNDEEIRRIDGSVHHH